MIKWKGHLRLISGFCCSSPYEDIDKAILDIQKTGYNLTHTKDGPYDQDHQRLEVCYSIESPTSREVTKATILTILLPLIRQSGGVAIMQEYDAGDHSLGYLGTDQDGTLLSEEILPLLTRANRVQIVRELTQRAMEGEEDFTTNFTRRSLLLSGYSTQEAIQVLAQIPLAPKAEHTIQILKNQGVIIDLITSNYSFFAQHLCTKYGLDGYCASTMGTTSNGIWSGKLLPPIIDAESKRHYLITRLRELGLSPAQSLCIGDGANDIPMLSFAGTSILYSSNPILSPIPWTFILPYFGVDSSKESEQTHPTSLQV